MHVNTVSTYVCVCVCESACVGLREEGTSWRAAATAFDSFSCMTPLDAGPLRREWSQEDTVVTQ